MPVAIRVIIVSSRRRSERAADDTNGHPPHHTTIDVRTKPRSPGDSPKGGASSRPNSEVPSGEERMIGTVRIADPTKRRSMSCAMCAPCPARASVMGPSVHAWHPVHLHTVFAHTHRLEPEIDRYSRRGTTAVDGIQARGDEVHRPAHADSGGEPRHGADRAEVPEGQRADIVLRRRGHRGDHEVLGALLHVLGEPEEGGPAIQADRTPQ